MNNNLCEKMSGMSKKMDWATFWTLFLPVNELPSQFLTVTHVTIFGGGGGMVSEKIKYRVRAEIFVRARRHEWKYRKRSAS